MTAATADIRSADRVRRMRSIGVLFVFFTLTFSAATRAQGLPESRVNQGLPEFHVNQRLPESARAERTDVQGAIVASLKLLMIEHGTRIMFQEKTRRELPARRGIRLPRRPSIGRREHGWPRSARCTVCSSSSDR